MCRTARAISSDSRFRHAARRLVAGEPGDSANVAARAAQECQRFTKHLARLLGEAGAQLLLRRSVVLASSTIAWLAPALTPSDPVSGLCATMAQQDSESIADAFVAILSALVGLLERLIGEGLVERQLADVWPTVFTAPVKDTL